MAFCRSSMGGGWGCVVGWWAGWVGKRGWEGCLLLTSRCGFCLACVSIQALMSVATCFLGADSSSSRHLRIECSRLMGKSVTNIIDQSRLIMQQDQGLIVDSQHPYASLINAHAHSLPTIFDIKPTDRKDGSETAVPFPLEMYCRAGSQDRPIFLYSFRFPVPPQTYIDALLDIPLQCKLDTLIDSYYRLPDSTPGTELLFLSYKKILIVMPRYFHYLRHTFHRHDHTYLLCLSLPGGPASPGTRGEIVVTVTRVRAVEGGCEVSVYSEVDMKMKLKWETAMAKGFTEIRKWLVRFHAALAV